MSEGGNEGPATDRHNEPVIDPTKNVLDLVAAAIQRQDDLRVMEAAHTDAILTLRAEYEAKLAAAESGRIDAIRAVDQGNITRAAEVAAQQAEALRTTVATTATAAQTSLTAALDPIQKDIADLRRAQYEAQGQKTQVVETRSHGTSVYQVAAIVVATLAAIISLLALVLLALHK